MTKLFNATVTHGFCIKKKRGPASYFSVIGKQCC